MKCVQVSELVPAPRERFPGEEVRRPLLLNLDHVVAVRPRAYMIPDGPAREGEGASVLLVDGTEVAVLEPLSVLARWIDRLEIER